MGEKKPPLTPEQWILAIGTFILGIFLALTSISDYTELTFRDVGLALGTATMVWLLGFFLTVWSGKISQLTEKVDLRLKKNDTLCRQIASYIEDFIDEAKKGERNKLLKKKLNGVKQSLIYKPLKEEIMRRQLCDALISRDWKQFISISTYGPAEWTDPYWFSFLTIQVARTAEMVATANPDEVTAKRYFIYQEKVAEEYRDELNLLAEAHGAYVRTYLFYLEEIEPVLKQKGIELIDLAFVDYGKGDNYIAWRNPEKHGETEQVYDEERRQSCVNLVRTLEILEPMAKILYHG